MNKSFKKILLIAFSFLLVFANMSSVHAASKKIFFDVESLQALDSTEVRNGIKDKTIKYENVYKLQKDGNYVQLKELDEKFQVAIISYMSEKNITDVNEFIKLLDDINVLIELDTRIKANLGTCQEKTIDELSGDVFLVLDIY